MDNATQGVIYMSLGSTVKLTKTDPHRRKIILEALSELPYKILLKYEADDMPNKPENVKICKWLPQQDVLRHPNLKLFITQAGLQSIEEVIASHVPLVALPLVFDQHVNAKKIMKLEIGLSLQFLTMTKEELKESIMQVIGNPKYKDNVKKIANIIDDRPMNGLENAIWWIEYVLRHNGAPYFRSAVVDMSWYQYFLVDVILFLLSACFIILYVLFKVVQLLVRIMHYTRNQKMKIN